MDQRDGPGPRPLVDRGVEAELGEIERRRLQRQRHVDRGAALVDRKADIDAGRDARTEPGDAAPGLALIADEIALRAGAWPRFRRPRPRSGNAAHRWSRRRRRRPDCCAARCRSRRSPGCRAAPGNCCRDWSRPRRPTASELIDRVGDGHRVAASATGRTRRRSALLRDADGDRHARATRARSRQPATSRRPVPVFPAREGRDEQRMNIIPKSSASSTKHANPHRPMPICPQFSRSVNRSWSSARGDCRPLLFRCHRSLQISRGPAPRSLLSAQISCCNIRHNRI